jgi:type IV pilus assembly protein PilM
MPLWENLKEKINRLGGWNSHTENLAGLDIGSGFVRIIKINSTKSPFLIENCAYLPVPAGTIVNNEIRHPVILDPLINELVSKAGLSACAVAIAMPRSLAIVKTITIDSRLSPDEIHSRAWIEANRHFPELVGNICLDYTITAPLPEDPTRHEMILAACRKDQLNPWLDLLKQANLDVRQVDLNCYALTRALMLTENPGMTETVALLNINLSSSSLIVIHKGNLVHSHDQDFDCQRLVNQISEFVKKRGTLAENELFTDAEYQTIFKENLVSHLRHVMHFFYSTQPEAAIQKVFLAGDCAGIPALFHFVGNEIGVRTELANPFRQMTFAEGVPTDEIKKHAPGFMLCCGLGIFGEAKA